MLNSFKRNECARHAEEMNRLESQLQYLQDGQEVRIAKYKPKEEESKADK
jgi:hypothetical protein